jgi:hypothetical protein
MSVRRPRQGEALLAVQCVVYQMDASSGRRTHGPCGCGMREREVSEVSESSDVAKMAVTARGLDFGAEVVGVAE